MFKEDERTGLPIKLMKMEKAAQNNQCSTTKRKETKATGKRTGGDPQERYIRHEERVCKRQRQPRVHKKRPRTIKSQATQIGMKTLSPLQKTLPRRPSDRIKNARRLRTLRQENQQGTDKQR